MLDIMNLRKRLSSSVPFSAFTLLVLGVLSAGSVNCGSDQACFYFTQIEYDIANSCPTRENALAFFKGNTCSTPVTSVDSDGIFDGTTCCYDVSNTNDFFTCGFDPNPVPPPEVTVGSSSGIGGTGGVSVGGNGGAGGTGGGTECFGCAGFLTNTAPPPFCSTDSQKLYEAYSECVCNGPCMMFCANSCSAMEAPTPECDKCATDSTTGCGTQQAACLMDP